MISIGDRRRGPRRADRPAAPATGRGAIQSHKPGRMPYHPVWSLFPAGAAYAGRMISVCLLLGAAGCSWTVIPPQTPGNEQTVYVSQYGWHTRLALPAAEDGHYIEYGFGDWEYYALGQRSLLSGLEALFFSSDSTLSRRVLPAPGQENLRLSFGSDQSASLTAPARKVDMLRDELEATWTASAGSHLQRGDLSFRKLEQDYGLLYNSNHQTANWLERLGSDVQGVTILGDFEVDH